MSKVYVASDRPAFRTGSMAYADQPQRIWRTRGPESGLVLTRTAPKPPVSMHERKRRACFGLAF